MDVIAGKYTREGDPDFCAEDLITIWEEMEEEQSFKQQQQQQQQQQQLQLGGEEEVKDSSHGGGDDDEEGDGGGGGGGEGLLLTAGGCGGCGGDSPSSGGGGGSCSGAWGSAAANNNRRGGGPLRPLSASVLASVRPAGFWHSLGVFGHRAFTQQLRASQAMVADFLLEAFAGILVGCLYVHVEFVDLTK
jgi:hypothetical protein